MMNRSMKEVQIFSQILIILPLQCKCEKTDAESIKFRKLNALRSDIGFFKDKFLGDKIYYFH